MIRQRTWLMGLGAGLLLAATALGAGPPTPGADDSRAREARALADHIDQYIADRWRAEKVQPARAADDAEFLRRVYLDLAGRVPSVAEARTFLDDKRPDKRQRLIERLLDGPRYVTHFADVWRSLMLPEAGTSLQGRFLVPGFDAWLRKELTANAGYDALVRELLTTPLNAQAGQRVLAFNGGGEASPAGFYAAKEAKPENLAGATSRLFLGVRLECAQCHNHPFARWKRDQFWSYAAFFAGVQRQGRGDFVTTGQENREKREIAIPGTERVVQAKFLDGTEPRFTDKQSPRETLAEWMTRADNPYFARAAVNRLWTYFFGTGLVEPVDEMVGGDHTPSHPELLDELAKQFAAHHFDLKFLMEAITTSRTYQLSSAGGQKELDPQLFGRMAVRGLSAEQLFDSLAQATGYQDVQGPDPRILFIGNGSPRTEFITRFANNSDRPTEVQTSILQALSLMNGSLTADVTSMDRSVTLTAVCDSPFFDTPGRIEALYLAALSRKPTPKELARLVAYVEKAGPDSNDTNQALADVFWALLNSSEFVLNH